MTTTAEAWLAGRIPADWFTGPVTIRRDRDELIIVGTLAAPDLPKDATDDDAAVAAQGRIRQFREDTRDRRIDIAAELERGSGKKVSWGVQVGDTEALFTHLAAPVMTRLRQPSGGSWTPSSTQAWPGPDPRRWPGASNSSGSTSRTGLPSCGTR